MYTIKVKGKNTRVMEFDSKDALIHYYVINDAALVSDAEAYIPQVFSDIALNENDCHSLFCGKVLSGDFSSAMFHPYQERRNTMVFDQDGRVIDIRIWLPEFRAAMKKYLPEKPNFPNFRFGVEGKIKMRPIRNRRGLKQKLAEVEQDDILEYLSAVPAGMTRGSFDKFAEAYRSNNSRSWKDQSKCRKSWQRRAGQPSARQIHKQDWMDELDLLAQEAIA